MFLLLGVFIGSNDIDIECEPRSTRNINYNFFKINIWVLEEGNTADTINPPGDLQPYLRVVGYYPFKGNLGVLTPIKSIV